MSRLLLMSDLHLGHRNICKYRTQFSNAEEHHNTIYENLATNINKADTLYLLGDVAFDKYWLQKIKDIKCKHKLLVCGNHDTERGIFMRDLVDVYDDVKSLLTHKNIWISHCPIHPQELRGRKGCSHGHLHSKIVEVKIPMYTPLGMCFKTEPDKRYINICVEHTNYEPIAFSEVEERFNEL